MFPLLHVGWFEIGSYGIMGKLPSRPFLSCMTLSVDVGIVIHMTGLVTLKSHQGVIDFTPMFAARCTSHPEEEIAYGMWINTSWGLWLVICGSLVSISGGARRQFNVPMYPIIFLF